MHRTDRTSPGRTLCGLGLPRGTTGAQHARRGFKVCSRCQTVEAKLPVPRTDRPVPSNLPTSQVHVTSKQPMGWVQLSKPPNVLHRPDPDNPNRVMCGPAMTGKRTIHLARPQPWPACPLCQHRLDERAERVRRQKRGVDSAADRTFRPLVSARVQRRLAAGRVLGDGPTGVAGSWQLPIGWVRLDDRSVWHQPHPERINQVMCELRLPAKTPVLRRRIGSRRTCHDCQAMRAAALTEIRERDRQDDNRRRPPIATDRVLEPLPLRTVRGGLPSLGRRR